MDPKKLSMAEKGDMGIFDPEAAMKGYALNKMCHSFNKEDCRHEFLADQDAYCEKYGLNDDQKKAVRTRDKTDFVMAGGSLYFYGKFIRMFPEAGANFAYSATVKGQEAI